MFSNRVVNRWNLLDQWTVNAPSLNAFKNGLSRIRDGLFHGLGPLRPRPRWGLVSPGGRTR